MAAVKTGYTFRKPNREIDWRLFATVEGAQTQAAFDHSERAGVTLPDDWTKAYNAGYRIVSATLSAGQSHSAWRRYARAED